jgi:hypothetical protein
LRFTKHKRTVTVYAHVFVNRLKGREIKKKQTGRKYFVKRIILIALSLLMLVSLTGCFAWRERPEHSEPEDEETDEETQSIADEPDTWVIYWYLCGSDLETNGGAATADLLELLEVTLPENVKVVIETGGASVWQNDTVNANYIERYLYDSNGFTLLEQLPLADMGDPNTLADFLYFAGSNYPAEKQMVLFWNHGGGSVTGVAFDELYGYDSLTLSEMYQAFNATYTLSEQDPPFEVIGFDACLMATLDTAYTFSDIGKYLVASEETEPGNGWYYSGFMGALAENPEMNGAELGQVICDTYVDGCELAETQDSITLSVTDLSKAGALVTAYDNIGREALSYACVDPTFFAEFGRSAANAENYGGNTDEQGYTNMVDLGDLVRKSEGILPEYSDAVLSALDECVIYKVNGPYRQQATGLSCYYSYNGDEQDYEAFASISPSEAFKYLYEYELSGELPEDGMEYISDMQITELQTIPTIADLGLDDAALTVDDEGYAVLNIGPEAANALTGVYFELFYVDYESDTMLLLGRDDDIYADWDNGVFQDNFRGVWGTIDGHFVYMELNEQGENYNLYNVPILLNGESYNLCVAYSFTDSAYYILGASKPLNETGMADKQLRQLVEGDVITTLMYMMPISGDSVELTEVESETFTVTADTVFEEADMGDGTFIMVFEMTDINNDSAFSEPATFTVEGDTIYTEVGY